MKIKPSTNSSNCCVHTQNRSAFVVCGAKELKEMKKKCKHSGSKERERNSILKLCHSIVSEYWCKLSAFLYLYPLKSRIETSQYDGKVDSLTWSTAFGLSKATNSSITKWLKGQSQLLKTTLFILCHAFLGPYKT